MEKHTRHQSYTKRFQLIKRTLFLMKCGYFLGTFIPHSKNEQL